MFTTILNKKRRMPFFGKCSCSGRGGTEIEEVNTLNYAHNNLTHVPEEIIYHERALEELVLDANRIIELPRWLFQCHGLRILSINDNEIQIIPAAIASLVNLETFDISKNRIQEIPDNIKCCKKLSVIEASVNPIGRLPEGFMMLINLRELYLNDTFLEYLPGSFGRLCKLKILEVRENRLKTLPKSLSRLTELERLDLGTNEFDVFPEVICGLVSLLELWMDSNKIDRLPNEIGNLRNLMFLDLSKNRLRYLPDEIGDCVNLSDLYLSENEIEELPETIGQLASLTILKLDSNKLKKLPFTIGGLSSMSELVLSNNQISEIPTSIGLLRNLRTFNLDENYLNDLPPDIGSCTGITLFSLRGNNLQYIPEEIGRISKLRVLNLSSNRLRHLPCSISKLKELQALWLAENQTKPLIPLQQDKDKNGRRFLTCYLFPQEQIRNSIDDNRNNYNKQNLSADNYQFYDYYENEEDNQQQQQLQQQQQQRFNNHNNDRQHLIRFAGDNINTNQSIMKPYPKEMKNLVQHVRNLAIYENTLSHSEINTNNNNNNNNNKLPLSSYVNNSNNNNNGNYAIDDNNIDNDDTQMLINHDLIENINNNRDTTDYMDLINAENMNKDPNNVNYRVKFAKNLNNLDSTQSPRRMYNSVNNNNNTNKEAIPSAVTSSPTTKLNHQKLMSKIHYEKVQEILQNNQNFQRSPLFNTRFNHNNQQQPQQQQNNKKSQQQQQQQLIDQYDFFHNDLKIQNEIAINTSFKNSNAFPVYSPLTEHVGYNPQTNPNTTPSHQSTVNPLPPKSPLIGQRQQVVNFATINNDANLSDSENPAIIAKTAIIAQKSRNSPFSSSGYQSDIDNPNSNNTRKQQQQSANEQHSNSYISDAEFYKRNHTFQPALRKQLNTTLNNENNLVGSHSYKENKTSINGNIETKRSYIDASKTAEVVAATIAAAERFSPKRQLHQSVSSPTHKSPVIQNSAAIPSSPLKVNVNDIKWSNIKAASINEPPSSQVSSDSGYGGQVTQLNSMKNGVDTSPVISNLNESTNNSGYDRQEYTYLNVQVVKNPGLGFSISGGCDQLGNPFKPNDPGIFVTKVQADGAASNLLVPSDQIIKVNGEDFQRIEHAKAVAILKSCNRVANLLIKRASQRIS